MAEAIACVCLILAIALTLSIQGEIGLAYLFWLLPGSLLRKHAITSSQQITTKDKKNPEYSCKNMFLFCSTIK